MAVATAPHDPAAAASGHEGQGGPGDHHGGVSVGVCLAVIAAMLLAGLGAWSSGLVTRLRAVVTEHAATVASVSVRAHARGPAPPDLTLLSIQRC